MTTGPDTDQLLEQASQGDDLAREQLLARHRRRLRRMVEVHFDRRLLPRVDPSDVVQEALAEAVRQLPDYLRHRPLPFYSWLRQLALDRLAELRRRHLQTQRRSIAREQGPADLLSDESVLELAGRLLARGSSPSDRLQRQELRNRLRAVLNQLPPRDRDVLVLRHLEQLSADEIAAMLSITPGAVYTRHVRALERLRALLGDDFLDEERP
jgi:RNA polymerase sigma-70 factor (ECF subfamily)